MTLRRPPPLDRPLGVDVVDAAEPDTGRARLLDGDLLVAEAELAAPLDREGAAEPAGSGAAAPAVEMAEASRAAEPAEARGAVEEAEPVDLATARAAERGYPGRTRHPFPRCFVCGIDRVPGDGLLLAPGPTAPGRTACVFAPDASLALPGGAPTGPANTAPIAPEFVWAALDCPGGWTVDLPGRPMVLGRITVEIYQLPRVGERYVVTGRALGSAGRRTMAATGLFDAAGRPLARARQVWVAVDPARFG